jgi:hypothetical protein
VRNGNTEFNVAHALSANNSAGNLHSTFLADNTLVADAAVLLAGTFVVLNWSKDALIKKPMLFRTLCSVVNGLRFGDLTK